MIREAALAAGVALLCAAVVSASGIVEEAALDSEGVDSIEVRSASLPVEARPGDLAEAALGSPMATEFPGDDVPRMRQERNGSTLRVWVEGDGRVVPAGAQRIIVRVPPGASLRVQTRSAPVTVEGLDGGACRVLTVSGPIVLRRDRCRLWADSVSGRIDMDLDQGSVQARTVSGRIEGRRLSLSGESDFTSVSGAIEVGLTADIEDYRFDLRSVSGTITLGAIRAERGLRMGFGQPTVTGRTISGALSFAGALPSTRNPPSSGRRSGAWLFP